MVDQEVKNLIGFLLTMNPPERILEIGTAYGFSSIYMSTFLRPGGTILTIERHDVMWKEAEKYIEKVGLTDVIDLRKGQASEILPALQQPYDFILLDVMLPKMIGFDVCRTLRNEGNNVPVIILTAREEESDKVLGLEIGADDYITKPFSMRELIARVGANIRRTAMAASATATAVASAMPVAGDLSINTDSHQVFRDGKTIDLTQREYELLTFLASHPNKVYSRVDLMEQVWNYGYVGDDVRTVDVTVRRLREKIEDDPGSPKVIKTKRGAGYYSGE
jgi:two-component system response regulator VicR